MCTEGGVMLFRKLLKALEEQVFCGICTCKKEDLRGK